MGHMFYLILFNHSLGFETIGFFMGLLCIWDIFVHFVCRFFLWNFAAKMENEQKKEVGGSAMVILEPSL